RTRVVGLVLVLETAAERPGNGQNVRGNPRVIGDIDIGRLLRPRGRRKNRRRGQKGGTELSTINPDSFFKHGGLRRKKKGNHRKTIPQYAEIKPALKPPAALFA
ncbi:MAG TPA: hypothetical protein PLE50_10395, partial [Rhabdaerophilum sp.]|nr:hypothetical protein [Rhabdaerophilum sp.]